MGHPRLWLGLGLLLLVTGAALSVTVAVFDPDDRALVETLAAVAAVMVPATAWLWRWAHSAKAPRLPLDRAADGLTEELRRQWERVAAEQGLIVPAPIPLRWHWSARPVAGSIAEVVGGSGDRQSRFAPLPGMAAVIAEQVRSGTLYDLFRIYGGLGSGRLILLGGPGAGKSGAGILLLLEALAHRAKLTAGERARVPVPVLVTPQNWDPTAEPFTEWLAARLAGDYALLRAAEYGEDAPLRLIESGYLAVIFDGLDEMPEALRSVALRALDEQATFRLVVLSRSEELVVAVSDAHHLRGAAALELMPIDAEQEANYLTSCLVDPLPPRWQQLIDYLRGHPDGVLTQALNTPLTLTLVRDTYGRGEGIDEPSDIYNSGSVDAIEERLLDQVLTAAYAQHPGRAIPPFRVDQARRWLGRLARRMNEEGTRDLTWWQIPRWVPAWPRAVFTMVAMSFICALIVASLGALAAGMHLLSTFEVGPVAAVVAAFGKTLGYAFMFGPGLLLMSPRYRRVCPQEGRLRWSGMDLLVIVLAALGVGLGLGLQNWFLQGSQRGLAIGLVASFVVALGFVFGGGPPQRLGWLRWSSIDTRTNVLTGLVIGLVAGLVTGFGYWLGYDLKHGLVYGLLVGAGYLLVIIVGGRPSHRRSQPLSRIDVPTVLLIGLVIAIASSAAGYGIAYILTVILGGRLPLLRSRLRWSRAATPTMLLGGLAAGSVLGLVFGLISKIFQRLSGQSVMYGPALGLAFGLMVGLLLGLRQPPTEATNPLDPQSLWRQERRFGLGFGLLAGLVYGLVTGLMLGLEQGILFGITAGLMIGIGSGLVSSVTWTVALTSAQLRRRDETPARLLRFLDDARKRQILRMVGSVYQFRHARLQNRLAGAYGTTSEEVSDKHANHIPVPRRPMDNTQERIVDRDVQEPPRAT